MAFLVRRGRVCHAMHEYSLVLSLLERVEGVVREHNATRVKGLRLQVGKLSGVEPELLVSAYEIAREGTLCAEAELEIQCVEPRWTCPRCGVELGMQQMLRCEACQEGGSLVAGGEILLTSLDLEVP